MIKIEDLKKQILLQGLKESDYKKLLSVLENRHYEKNETIFNEGDPHGGIYLIKQGRVSISKSIQDGHPITLVVFREGNYFGDISALEKRPHSSTATALSEVEIFLLGFENIDCRKSKDFHLSCILLTKLAMIASKNLRHMNVKYLRLEESF